MGGHKSHLSVEVCLLLEKPRHHALKVLGHVVTEVVKLGQEHVVQGLAVLTHLFRVLLLQKKKRRRRRKRE